MTEENKTQDNIKAAIEAMLFASDKPLLIEQLRKALDNLEGENIRAIISELKKDYEQANRGIRIFEVAGGFQMIAAPDFASFLKKLFKGPRNSDRLSKQAMETLAIIAYKQPLSKLEIESLRRVNIDGVMQTLLEKNVIRVAGRKKTPGRPKVYGTTRYFLEYFGLKSLEELPKIENFPVPEDSKDESIESVEELSENISNQKDNNNVIGETAKTD
jgi:segregation and condensation protein B